MLIWEKPKKLKTTQEHNDTYGADGAPPGAYVPNMSNEDKLKWKAKRITGKDYRVEIRKTIIGTQMVVIVRPDSIKISANGPINMSHIEFNEFNVAIKEAKLMIHALPNK